MSLRVRVEEMWYGAPGEGTLLSLLLAPASWSFLLAAELRNLLYDSGMRQAEYPPVPCVSVGNLVAGGTGKTPVTRWISDFYLRRGMKPAVISRGYLGEERGPAVVTSGQGAARRYGDEPVMLTLFAPGIPVVVGRDRVAAGRTAASACGAEVLVADDAFQHRRLGRNLDIVVVDAVRFMGNGCPLPRGPMRERLAALRRADIVLLTGATEAGDLLAGRKSLLEGHAPGADFVEADMVPAGWRLFDGEAGDPAEQPRGPLFAFCGLANPGSFARTLREAGCTVRGWRTFPDHHPYSPGELETLDRDAREEGATAAVTTAKDAVRIRSWQGERPLYVLDGTLRVVSGEDRFKKRLLMAAEGGRA